jgi:hypothetical protein
VPLTGGDQDRGRAGLAAIVLALLTLDVGVDGVGDELVGATGFVLWRSQILPPSECPSGGAGFGAFADVRRFPLTSAAVGCVGGPVSEGCSLLGDGDADVDAEQSC